MKKNYAFGLILIVVLCIALCACDGSGLPWADKTVDNNNGKQQTYVVYVCGAVENEGYYEVEDRSTYFAAILQAGLVAQSFLPQNTETVVASDSSIIVQYVEDGVVRDCVDVNNPFFSLRDASLFEGLSEEVVAKIADYLEKFGAIHNKHVLREVLGEDDYENYHYKLYVAEADYEKAY